MEIRTAKPSELEALTAVYEDARAYMRGHGNPNQWGSTYPPRALICADIDRGFSHVCTENGQILGAFSWIPGPDPTYAVIGDGAWLNDRPYMVIHRVAVRVHRRGVASAIFAWAMERCTELRIDTHADNVPMQRSLEKNGFTRCGVIHLADGAPRIAYQKSSKA